MKIVLIVPPFGPIAYPVLGPSLLKAILRRRGFDCTVEYATLAFAARIGFDAYASTYHADPPLLLGDRIFAPALFGEAAPPAEVYWHEVAIPFAEGVETRLQLRRHTEERLRQLQAQEEEALRLVDDVARSPAIAQSDVVGLSSTFGQHAAALAIAKRVKELHPRKVVVLGGANCEGPMGRQTLASFPFLDWVSLGPADSSLPAFLEQLAAGRTPRVPGIIGRGAELNGARPAEVALDDLPDPDFDDFFAAYDRHPAQRRRIYSLPVEGARGCWWGEKHHCIFCGINGEQMPFRRKSAARFHGEIQRLVVRYGVRRIWATDNILDMDAFRDLLPLLERERNHEELFFEVKANLRREHVEAFARAGITRLQPGIESLDTGVLRLMDKGTTALRNLELLRWAEELGIALQWNLLCGFPGEDPSAYRRMYELMQLVPHLPPPKACSQITIDRFSPLHREPARFGIQVEPAKAYRYVYPLEPAAIAGLAYFHSQRSATLDTTDSLAVPAYAGDVFRQTRIWQSLYRRVRLECRVRGDDVEIVDTRPFADVERRRLTGLDARVLLAADAACSREQIAASVSAAVGDVRGSLERLAAWGYVWGEGGRFLSLAPKVRDWNR